MNRYMNQNSQAPGSKTPVQRKGSDSSTAKSQQNVTPVKSANRVRPRTAYKKSPDSRLPPRETCYSNMVSPNQLIFQNDCRFYKETYNWKKKVTQTKTTYNFLQEHSDQIPHVVSPMKAQARCTESGIRFKQTKYENQSVQEVLSGSPKKKYRKVDYFKQSEDDNTKSPISMKKITQVKNAELAGTNPCKPLTQEQLNEQNRRYGSPEKQSRVEGIHGSSLAQQCLTFEQTDFKGIVNAKINKAAFDPSNLRKEQWKPKTTTKWTEPYRAPLTLQ